MKAVLNEDIIVKFDSSGTEIGPIPKNIGLERLRFDGNKIIDLADLDKMYVRYANGIYELHVIQVKNSQLVTMTYADRKNLTVNNGTIRVLTQEEIDAVRIRKYNEQLKAKAQAYLSNNVGSLEKRTWDLLALICALIVYARLQPQVLSDWFDELIPHIQDTFPLNTVKPIIEKHMKEMKIVMDEYFNNLQ